MKINLLRSQSKSKRPSLSPFRKRPLKPSVFALLFAVVLLIFEFAFLATFNKNISHKISALAQYRSRLNREISSHQRELVKVKTRKKGGERPQAVSITEILKQDNEKLIDIFKAFSKALPSKAWMSQISQKNLHFQLKGFAVNHKLISNFVTKLQSSKQFSSVKLIQSKQARGKERDLKQFSILCSVEQI